MWNWFSQHEELLWWMGVISIITFLGSLIAIPWMVAKIRPDYFLHPSAPSESWQNRHPVIRFALHVVKNLVGVMLIFAGIAMLVLPGQGVLTILVGVTLLDFPGKRKAEFWFIRQRGVLKAVNWIRSKSHQQPLEVPEKPTQSSK